MAELWAIREGDCLTPWCSASLDAVQKLPLGQPVRVDFKQPRNPKFHRLWWAFCGLVAGALNEGVGGNWDAEKVTLHCKVALSLIQYIEVGDIVVAVPASISFAKLDETGFRQFVLSAWEYVATDLAPWIREAENWPQIQGILAEAGL